MVVKNNSYTIVNHHHLYILITIQLVNKSGHLVKYFGELSRVKKFRYDQIAFRLKKNVMVELNMSKNM